MKGVSQTFSHDVLSERTKDEKYWKIISGILYKIRIVPEPGFSASCSNVGFSTKYLGRKCLVSLFNSQLMSERLYLNSDKLVAWYETCNKTLNDQQKMMIILVISKSETVFRVIVVARFPCPSAHKRARNNKKENMMHKAAIFFELFKCVLEVPTLSFLHKWYLPFRSAIQLY